MFELSDAAIDLASLSAQLQNHEAGAYVSFEGRVRINNDGKMVSRLEYEAYPALAMNEANKIMEEARRLFPLIELRCVHRTGALEIGDLAVWVGVLSRHRAEAFDACRYVIDQVKARVPIWKKEFYVDGSSVWVNCAECASHSSNGQHAKASHE
ncbi:MAG: molybdenum cofactor biosynthesis protein MoaE [Candidatus Obscuribacterales bacterium]|nr:molybdenum cofactor biosynthesis protein MoaE [Candidatus Obscuribacterales bacterium]